MEVEVRAISTFTPGEVEGGERRLKREDLVLLTGLKRSELNWRVARVVADEKSASAPRVGVRLLAHEDGSDANEEPEAEGVDASAMMAVRRRNLAWIDPAGVKALEVANLYEVFKVPAADCRRLVRVLQVRLSPPPPPSGAG